jgi:putative intracellular protease/amidase
MTKNILVLATNTSVYQNSALPTGLWLGELTHFWDIAVAEGCALTLASPAGGKVPIDPESLSFFVRDASVTSFMSDPGARGRLDATLSVASLSHEPYDGIYLTGGHGTMYDFVDNPSLARLMQSFFEAGKVVAAVCHGTCGLLDVTLKDGSPLLQDRAVTGYAWIEETLARRKRVVPFNLESRMKALGARYAKGVLPFVSFTQEDGNLLTGQNPFSTKALARLMMRKLDVAHSRVSKP